MQLFLFGYIIISLCEIFTVGGFPLARNVRIVWSPRHPVPCKADLVNPAQAFTGIHLGAIVATTWILLMNAVVGFQLIDDGTPLSIGLIIFSAAALFIGTGYIALDTGFSWTDHFDRSLTAPNRNIGLYVLYQLAPLIFLALFFLLEIFLVLRVLGEVRPLCRFLPSGAWPTIKVLTMSPVYLIGATLLFAIGQIFQYVISTHLCNSTSGRIDGALFETLFTLLAVAMLWVFWSSITEDDWPMPAMEGTTGNHA